MFLTQIKLIFRSKVESVSVSKVETKLERDREAASSHRQCIVTILVCVVWFRNNYCA